jgi:hypothetical protein
MAVHFQTQLARERGLSRRIDASRCENGGKKKTPEELSPGGFR